MCAAVVLAVFDASVESVAGTPSEPSVPDPHALVNDTTARRLHKLRMPVVVARRFLAGNGEPLTDALAFCC